MNLEVLRDREEIMNKRFKRVSLIGLVAGGILLSTSAVSHADIYMKIDGVQGESTVTGRAGQIEVGDFTFGVTAPAATNTTSMGISTGKPKFQEVTVKKFFDSATDETLKMLGTSKSFNSIVIEVTKANGDHQQNYVRYTFTNCFITGDNMVVSGEDEISEAVSFIYKGIKVDYFKSGADGKVATTPQTFAFDLSTMKLA